MQTASFDFSYCFHRKSLPKSEYTTIEVINYAAWICSLNKKEEKGSPRSYMSTCVTYTEMATKLSRYELTTMFLYYLCKPDSVKHVGIIPKAQFNR